jgi:hypothetical protein
MSQTTPSHEHSRLAPTVQRIPVALHVLSFLAYKSARNVRNSGTWGSRMAKYLGTSLNGMRQSEVLWPFNSIYWFVTFSILLAMPSLIKPSL